jgi:hypothetical protein
MTINTRICELPECGVDISDMRRGTRFCSRSCAAKARYKPTGRQPGRAPKGEEAKWSSVHRHGRRIAAKDMSRAEAEIRALKEELARKVGVVLPPEPGPEYEWISSPTWREDRERWQAMRGAYNAAAREAGLRLQAAVARGEATPHEAFVFSSYCRPEVTEDLRRAWQAMDDALRALTELSKEDREALLSEEDRALLAEYERDKAMEIADWHDRKKDKDPYVYDIR